ncbi:MAG TPA: lysophospholipid acyltransferase family protein [Symbiobacteriaceae bacterium]|jgi:1-acyl-sn-glycerol-3-phosphate acyltransferase
MAQTHSEPAVAGAGRWFRVARWIGRSLLLALFRLDVEGLDRLPAAGGYVLICNHLSWIDGLVVLASLPAEPRIHLLAAAEYTVAGPWPMRLLVRLVGGVIPVDRQSHKGDRAAVVQALRVLKGGGVLGIFPEGRTGEAEGQLLPFKEGAASFAARTGSLVQVVALSGTLELCYRRWIRLRVGPLLEPLPGESQAAMLARMAEALAATVPPLHPGQPHRRRMRWLARLF